MFTDKKILLLDGSTGVEFQRMHLSEEAVRGRRFITHTRPLAANFDILNLSRPELVSQVHRGYLDAGADIIETNTFNSNRLSQHEYATDHLIQELNLAGARIAARQAAEYTARTGRRRYVAGAMGPTAHSSSLPVDVNDVTRRAVDFETLADVYDQQAGALIDGGVDFLLIETIFDLLNAKAAAEGARRAMDKSGKTVPLVFSFTLSDASGRILSGHTPEAILATMAPYRPAALGFNCSAGPENLESYARTLAEISPYPVIFYPNAGMPDRAGNYNIDASAFAAALRPLIHDGCVSIVGGCCGTGPEHIAALRNVIDSAPAHSDARHESSHVPWLAGMEAFYDDRGFINVGERCNVAGSRKFLRLISAKKYDEALVIARKQVEDGAMALDINMDDGMLQSREEMVRFLRVLGSDPLTASLPWMIDSSDFGVIEEALRNIGGRAIVNSISLKHGEEEFLRQAEIIRRYGASVVVMLFDERGQADTLERKKEVAARAINLLTERCGFERRDIVIDPNVLTIATGMPEHDAYALWFIDAVQWINETYPGVKTSGGVSNLSFAFRGNNPLRQSMHAVFLYHAIRAGLSMAIVDPATKVTYEDIPVALRELIEDAVLCRREDGGTRLAEAASQFTSSTNNTTDDKHADSAEQLPVDQRIISALLRGDDSTLADDIPQAVKTAGNANAVVENILMQGMEEVGLRFETGRMFLPQVVKSARTMHRAVALLQPYMEKEGRQGQTKGTFLVATVKGDVHDIGKNIAAVVLRCNNYEVIDLGVQVDAMTIVSAVREHNPDYIALSGLISPSLEEMARILEVMHREGIAVPVLVGGAATSDLHTALRLAPAYGHGVVVRVADASQDPLIASRLTADFDRWAQDIHVKQTLIADEYNNRNSSEPLPQQRPDTDWDTVDRPIPSFTGKRTLPEISLEHIRPYINWIYFSNCWKVSADSTEGKSLRSDAEKLLDKLTSLGATMRAQVAFYPAYGGDDFIDVAGIKIETPRQQPSARRELCLSLSDFVAPKGYGDHIGCFAVTTGDVIRSYECHDEYEQLLLQSVADRLAEATSEWLHRQVRTTLWGYAPDEPEDMDMIRHGRYRGIRPAVGYSSLPDQLAMHKLMRLLNPSAIDVAVTENGALNPASSVAGFYIAAPHARYF